MMQESECRPGNEKKIFMPYDLRGFVTIIGNFIFEPKRLVEGEVLVHSRLLTVPRQSRYFSPWMESLLLYPSSVVCNAWDYGFFRIPM